MRHYQFNKNSLMLVITLDFALLLLLHAMLFSPLKIGCTEELLASKGGEIVNLVRLYQPSLEEAQATQIEKSVLFWTEKRRINLHSFLAIIIQESKFDPSALGKAGERGLCQVSKTCLRELKRVYGEEFDFNGLFEIDYNLMVGSLHYRYCVELANYNRREAIARYRTTFVPEESSYYAKVVLRIRESVEERLRWKKN